MCRRATSQVFQRVLVGLLMFGVFGALVSGCGYQFQGSGTVLPPDIKTVAILPVENETTESALGLKFREALRSRFERYGALEVVESPEAADVLLAARIVSVTSRVRAVTGTTDVSLAQDLTLTVSAELKRRNGQILWRETNLQASEPFAQAGGTVVTGSPEFIQGGIGAAQLGSLDDLQVSRGQKEQTLSELVEETARKVYLAAVAPDF